MCGVDQPRFRVTRTAGPPIEPTGALARPEPKLTLKLAPPALVRWTDQRLQPRFVVDPLAADPASGVCGESPCIAREAREVAVRDEEVTAQGRSL